MNNRMILEINDLEKIYYGSTEKLTILKNLNLTVSSASKVIITGESGCGKSTLLNIIGGIDSPTAGNVKAGMFNVTELGEDDLTSYRSRFLGLIFQFHYLLKDFTALENVFMPAYMMGIAKKEAMERARQLLSDVGLEKRFDHLPSQLSGGERQRVSVARSLINDPDLILADEPTGNLDPSNAMLIGRMLFSLVDRYGKTLLLVTHDMSLAEKGDCVYRLHSGRLETV